jgi:hypothetical protein
VAHGDITVYCILNTVYLILNTFTLFSQPSTQYSVPSTQYPVQSTQYPLPSTQYSVPVVGLGAGCYVGFLSACVGAGVLGSGCRWVLRGWM